MLTPAYTAIEPMTKSTMPQINRIGMNTSISRRLCAQVLLANSEMASRMWKPPSTNIIIAAYVSQPERPIVGVLSLLCSTISSFLSRLSLLRVSVRWHHAMVYGSPQKKGAPTPQRVGCLYSPRIREGRYSRKSLFVRPHRLRACANRERLLVKRARIARSFGELSKLPCEGANPCPHYKHTSSSPSGNSSPRYCLKES